VIKTKQSILISFEFEMAFLKWNEFPPDPNHGFYIPSAVVSTLLPSKTKSNYILRSLNSFSLNQRYSVNLNQSSWSLFHFSLSSSSDGFVRLYSESLLVNLPTPDFSMPFNVICLGCTAVALAFGGLHNLTTKEFRFSEKRPKVVFRQRLEDLRFRVMAARHALAQRIFRKQPQQQEQREHAD
jgi:phosphatidylinositol glycan class T